jgi:hypothetical protein
MGDSFDEKYAGINAYEGGFMVSFGGKTVIVTSLNKAIKLVREYLAVPGTTEGE